MATRLDQQIELLVNIVERHLDLCEAARNGIRCTLQRNHEPATPHRFSIEFPKMPARGGTHMSSQTGRASKNQTEHKTSKLEVDGFPPE
jgi:hypothetical protein